MPIALLITQRYHRRLSLLEENGLIIREINSTISPCTTYTLTERGRALKPMLDAIGDWANSHMQSYARCQTATARNNLALDAFVMPTGYLTPKNWGKVVGWHRYIFYSIKSRYIAII